MQNWRLPASILDNQRLISQQETSSGSPVPGIPSTNSSETWNCWDAKWSRERLGVCTRPGQNLRHQLGYTHGLHGTVHLHLHVGVIILFHDPPTLIRPAWTRAEAPTLAAGVNRTLTEPEPVQCRSAGFVAIPGVIFSAIRVRTFYGVLGVRTSGLCVSSMGDSLTLRMASAVQPWSRHPCWSFWMVKYG